MRPPESREQRFRRALELEERLAADEEIDTTDAVWLGGYQVGSEYQAMRSIYEDFGVEALR